MLKAKLKYSDTRLIKRKNKGRFKGFLIFVFCVICCVFVFVLAGGLGNVLKVGSFSFLFKNNNDVVAEHSYYAVVMGEYETHSEAQAVASGVAVMGAGAYVWQTENKFLVVGNVYENKSDAEQVLKNIGGSGYNAFVKEIKFNKISLETSVLNQEQTQVVFSAVKFVDDVFLKCYDYAVKFDKSEIVSTVVSSELNTLKGSVRVWEGKLDVINSYAVTNLGLLIKNALVAIELELDAAVLKVINGTSVNKDLKYLTTSVAIAKFNMYNSIKSL